MIRAQQRPGMRFDLNRMAVVMKALGNPQDTFPSIQVAGTNGKGSVSALLHQILTEAGLKTGLYTSPHLERVNERFKISGRDIPDRDLKKCARILRHVLTFPLTEFEFLTALAFLWFRKEKVDVAVLEVGLGGRLDATNIVRHVLAGVITNIELDHTEWLGNTLEKIAAEKSGIIKINVPIVTGAGGKALEVIRQKAARRNAPFFFVPHTPPRSLLPQISGLTLTGSHQKHNAALTVETIRLIRPYFPELDPVCIRRGLRRVVWPGRFEKVKLTFDGKVKTVILDGAHNPAAAHALANALREQRMTRIDLLFGALKDKDIPGIISSLSSFVRRCYVARVPSERSAAPSDVVKRKEWRGNAAAARSVQEGFYRLLREKDGPPVLVTGSLYLVGAVRQLLKRKSHLWNIVWE